MNDKNESNANKNDIVKLDCASGGCCPDAEFRDDGTVVLTDEGQTIVMLPHSMKKLFEEYNRRGH